MHLLGATEKLVCVTYPTLISKIPAILNAYYSSDIVDEPVFVEWAAAAETEYLSAKKHKSVVENAAQFMEWLKVGWVWACAAFLDLFVSVNWGFDLRF